MVFYIVWKMPIVSYYISSYIAMGLLAILFVVFILRSKMKLTSMPLVLVSAVMYIILMLLEKTVLRQGNAFYALWDIFLAFIPFVMGPALIMQNDRKMIDTITCTLIISYSITALTTYVGLLAFPGASRIMAADSLAYHRYYPYNIGGFGFVYSLVLLHPLFVCLLKNKQKTGTAILLSLITGLAIFESEYTTATLLFIFSCMVYVLPLGKEPQIVRSRMLAIGLVAVISILFLPSLLRFISEWDALESSAEKITDIANMLQGKRTTAEDTELRKLTYQASWDTFLSNPILGTSFFESSKVGGHSLMLDCLANWGLIGFSVFLFLLYCLWNFYKQVTRKSSYIYVVIIVFLSAIVLMALNPTFWAFELGLAIPILIERVCESVGNIASPQNTVK